MVIFATLLMLSLIVTIIVLMAKLTCGLMKIACMFTKPAFALFLASLMNDIQLIQGSSFWNTVLVGVIFYGVIFLLCGFPRVNLAFNVMTSMIITFLTAAVAGGLLTAIAGTILGDDLWPCQVWKEHYIVICLVLSIGGPLLTAHLREDSDLDLSMTEHSFSFGVRWPIVQRVLASLLYAFYPWLLIGSEMELGSSAGEAVVGFSLLGVLAALAYLVQLFVERRRA